VQLLLDQPTAARCPYPHSRGDGDWQTALFEASSLAASVGCISSRETTEDDMDRH